MIFNQEESSDNFSIAAPAIEISTPYGDVSAQPKMSYSSTMQSTLFPSGDVIVDMGNLLVGPAQLANVLGTIGGVVLETLDNRPNHGWVSQLGMGSRQASHSTDPIWPGGLSLRPDIANMTQARTQGELQPVGDFEADVDIQYKPPIPSFLLVSPLAVKFDLMVDPKVELRYSSALETEFSDSFQEAADEGPGTNGRVIIKSRAEGNASFELQAGVDLRIDVNLPIGGFNVINIQAPQITVPVTSDPKTGERVIGEALVYPNPSGAKPNSVYNAPLVNLVASTNSGTPNGETFVNQCLTTKTPPAAPPQPNVTPGNASLFQNNLYYPCNICVGNPLINYTQNGILKSIAANWEVLERDTQGGLSGWTCDVDHIGCFDMCTFNAKSKQLVLWKNAMQLDAANKKGPGISSATHPGLACNIPWRPAQ